MLIRSIFLGFVLILGISCSCRRPLPPLEGKTIHITMCLLDISGSFNKNQPKLHWSGDNNYFIESLKDIKDSIRALSIGDSYTIRFISENGYSDENYFGKLDFTTGEFFEGKLEKPETVYDERKKKSEQQKLRKRILAKADSLKRKFIGRLDSVTTYLKSHPSNYSDICCSILSCHETLTSIDTSIYRRRLRIDGKLTIKRKLLIYSDMQEAPTQPCCQEFDFSGIDVEARNVSNIGHTGSSFGELKNKWEKVFKGVVPKFTSPSNSSND